MRKFIICIFSFLFFSGLAKAQDIIPQAELALSKLEIVTQTGIVPFTVELAQTDQERRIGMMGRTELASGRGMLFDFERIQIASMWMQNTVIPLDMIFIKPNGVIDKVHANARPQSTQTISSNVPVLAVLEIKGGEAELLNIQAGDKVYHPLFER